MKRVILIITALTTSFVSLILTVLDKNCFPVLGIGLLLMFLVYALWNPPEKHKNYSLSDQQQATSRALGGGGTNDLLDIKPSEKKFRKRMKKNK